MLKKSNIFDDPCSEEEKEEVDFLKAFGEPGRSTISKVDELGVCLCLL